MEKRTTYLILPSALLLVVVFVWTYTTWQHNANLVRGIGQGSQVAAVSDFAASLVDHWTFDEGSATGQIANAITFDGISDYVSISNPESLSFDKNYTISFWLKPSANFSGTIFRISNSVSNTLSRSKYEIRANGSSVSFSTGDGSTADNDSFLTSIPSGSWTFIACTLDNNNTKACYKNGTLISTATNDVNTSLTLANVGFIGTNRNASGNNFYEGALDDMRIYSKALSTSEINSLYTDANGVVVPITNTTEQTNTSTVTQTPTPTPQIPGTVSTTIPVDGTCTKISQYGITWIFDKAYPCGTFANGDYWIVGPAVITKITPDFTGTINGWEVNPASSGITSTMQQGFDSYTSGFSANLVPSLPYTAAGGQSIVKSVHAACAPNCNNSTSVLQTAAVLTVLGNIPPDKGTTVFRPPYVGTSKPLYRTTSLRTNLLPSLKPVGTPPTLDTIRDNFSKVQLDHFFPTSASWRNLHPIDNMPDYGGDIGRRNSNVLRLFLNDSIAAKMPALIAYTQYGIDMLHMAALGQTWRIGGSGHKPGQILPLAFASVMLNDSGLNTMMQKVSTSDLEENISTYTNQAGLALFGQVEGTGPSAEQHYWDSVAQKDGFKTRKDPYEYIDGGYNPGTSYQSIITPVFRSEVLVFDLIPELKTRWYKKDFFDYVHRSMDLGAWSQPDPCAPFDGNLANYGKTFGPNGKGGCILDTNPADGVGRFPTRHGMAFYSVAYKTAFQDAMWDAYNIKYSSSYNPGVPTVPTPVVNVNTTPEIPGAGNVVSGTPTPPLAVTIMPVMPASVIPQPVISGPTTSLPNNNGGFNRYLTIGSTGSDVKVLQQTLNNLGYTVATQGSGSRGNETTYFGLATTRALQKLQCSLLSICSGSPSTNGYGNFGPLTRSILNTRSGSTVVVPPSQHSASFHFTRPLTLGSRGNDVLELQKYLNTHGFTIATRGSGSPGNETTYFGPATKNAVIRFQEANRATILSPMHLTQGTGYVGTGTIKVLNTIDAPVQNEDPTITATIEHIKELIRKADQVVQ